MKDIQRTPELKSYCWIVKTGPDLFITFNKVPALAPDQAALESRFERIINFNITEQHLRKITAPSNAAQDDEVLLTAVSISFSNDHTNSQRARIHYSESSGHVFLSLFSHIDDYAAIYQLIRDSEAIRIYVDAELPHDIPLTKKSLKQLTTSGWYVCGWDDDSQSDTTESESRNQQ